MIVGSFTKCSFRDGIPMNDPNSSKERDFGGDNFNVADYASWTQLLQAKPLHFHTQTYCAYKAPHEKGSRCNRDHNYGHISKAVSVPTHGARWSRNFRILDTNRAGPPAVSLKLILDVAVRWVSPWAQSDILECFMTGFIISYLFERI